MRILVTNDDGYQFSGITTLIEMMRPFGEMVVVSPKYHQSGMSCAVSMGFKPIAVKKVKEEPGVEYWYVDGTPASCVKWALDEIYKGDMPDLLVSGINHGANTATAALYSGTLGACKEGTLAGVMSVGISIDAMTLDPDFSAIKLLFPDILKKLIANRTDRFGVYYNVNFPNTSVLDIKGIKVARQGIQHWEKEFIPYDRSIFTRMGIRPSDIGICGFPEVLDGETVYMMAGTMVNDSRNTADCDNVILADNYITVTAHSIDTTDYQEMKRLCDIF